MEDSTKNVTNPLVILKISEAPPEGSLIYNDALLLEAINSNTPYITYITSGDFMFPPREGEYLFIYHKYDSTFEVCVPLITSVYETLELFAHSCNDTRGIQLFCFDSVYQQLMAYESFEEYRKAVPYHYDKLDEICEALRYCGWYVSRLPYVLFVDHMVLPPYTSVDSWMFELYDSDSVCDVLVDQIEAFTSKDRIKGFSGEFKDCITDHLLKTLAFFEEIGYYTQEEEENAETR